MIQAKSCSKCERILPFSGFHKHSRHKDGLATVCRECSQATQRRYYQQNKLRHNEYTSLYYRRNKEKMRAYSRHYDANVRDKVRSNTLHREWYHRQDAAVKARIRERRKTDRDAYKRLAIEMLGGKCFCCGITVFAFLTIDHRKNDGFCDRKNGRSRMSGYSFYKHVLTCENAADRYQIACYNCNMGRAKAGKGGECPHSPNFALSVRATGRSRDEKRARLQDNEIRWRSERRHKVEAILGSVCYCCGEDNRGFLTIDHIHGDGYADRKKNGRKMNMGTFYGHILAQPDPKSRYRVACYNCNIAREFANLNGLCPHQA